MIITLEGIDGCGKSTQAKRLQKQFHLAGRKTLLVREPGGTELSERIRSLLLDPQLDVSPRAELLLYSAARAQLVKTQIQPALDAGTVVICDRFFDSTVAYQGFGRVVASPEWILEFSQFVTAGLTPDKTFWIDVPLDVARRRRANETDDRIEAAGDVFFQKVQEGYEWLYQNTADRIIRINGDRKPDHVFEEIIKHLSF